MSEERMGLIRLYAIMLFVIGFGLGFVVGLATGASHG